MDIVKSRASRILHRLAYYRELPNAIKWPSYWSSAPRFHPGETPLGTYENRLGQAENSIVVTSFGLHFYTAGEWIYAAYSSIHAVQPSPPLGSPEDKLAVSGLALRLRDGTTLTIPVSGGNQQCRDAWEFLRFLDRVTQDIQHPRTIVNRG
jgi:hypothetical protein